LFSDLESDRNGSGRSASSTRSRRASSVSSGTKDGFRRSGDSCGILKTSVVSRGQEGDVRPGKVASRERGSVVSRILLPERTGRRSVLLNDGDAVKLVRGYQQYSRGSGESSKDVQIISIFRSGSNDSFEFSVSLLVGTDSSGRNEVLEEPERGRGDVDLSVLVPDRDGAVDLLGWCESRQMPGVSVVVAATNIIVSSASGRVRRNRRLTHPPCNDRLRSLSHRQIRELG